MNETDLILEGMGENTFFPPFSARECLQSLEPISQIILRRTINGALVCVGNKGHRKFRSVISCKDTTPPAFEKLWTGTPVKVGCIQPLTQTAPKGIFDLYLERDPVRGYAHDLEGRTYPIENIKERHIFLPREFPGGFVTYRPWLFMIVKHYCLETDEWGASVGWRLELEEE
jgi:hypothetical protein